MHWLVTVARDVDRTALADELNALDAAVRFDDAVPVGDDEQILFVDGPADLPVRVRQAGLPVHSVHPDSDQTAY